MRIHTLLFAVGSLATQITLAAPANAATDIFVSRTNNDFAVATSNPDNGPSQQVTVTRTTGVSGGIITELGFYYVAPNGCFFAGFGQIPNQDFNFTPKSASLTIDTSSLPAGTIQFFGTCPDATPPAGVISVQWTATSATRTSGTSVSSFGGTTIRISGTRLDTVAAISGTIFGTTLVDPFQLSYLNGDHTTTIIMQRD